MIVCIGGIVIAYCWHKNRLIQPQETHIANLDDGKVDIKNKKTYLKIDDDIDNDNEQAFNLDHQLSQS